MKSIIKIPLNANSPDKTLNVNLTDSSELQLERGNSERCTIPREALRQVLVEIYKLAREVNPSPPWQNIEDHGDYWNKHKDKRLETEFNAFSHVFIYLAAAEHGRSENSIKARLTDLHLTKRIN